jgi:DNA-binding NarL/FixJ family response regulator
LTPTMREILSRHANGSNLSQTARDMYLSDQAVFNYVATIKKILDKRTVAGCCMEAFRLGHLVFLPDGSVGTGREAECTSAAEL